MNKKIFIVFILFIYLLIIPSFYQLSFSKYVFNDSFIAAKIQIDKKPIIEVLSISNTNVGYEKYANNTHDITLRVKITEKTIVSNHFNDNTIQILLHDEPIISSMKINLVSNNHEEMLYDIILSNLNGNGKLSIVFPEGIIEDASGLKNDFQKFDTGISIDNIAPNSTCEEISIENDKSQYTIHTNEKLRPINGWDFYNTNSSLSKIFSSPISYPIFITDYAGNVTEAFVEVKNAKNIMVYYSNDNGYPITQFDNNGEISGKQAILDSSNSKTERIVTCIEGDIDNCILQSRAFDYTYWSTNTPAICKYSKLKYTYGYSPSPTTWHDITGQNVLHSFGKLCFQLGGSGHNVTSNSCINQKNLIPQEVAKQNLYGLSGIAFQLKDCNEYSIVYQIYVPSIGWLKASSDGEETTYSHDKPFSAIRITIVPKSEKQYLVNYWNRVIYTDYTG